ncbi:MAG: hypothetical protein AAF191_19145, partial [Verrucomicrobiota bacterium]
QQNGDKDPRVWMRSRPQHTEGGSMVAASVRRVPQYEDTTVQEPDGVYYRDRFGRMFKVFKAKPYRPGVTDVPPTNGGSSIWQRKSRNNERDILEVPRPQDPLETLPREGFPHDSGDYGTQNRYGETTPSPYPHAEAVPDLSQYPRYPEEPAVPREETRRPELLPVPQSERPPFTSPSTPRHEQPSTAPLPESAPAPRSAPPATPPPAPPVAPNPYDELPIGVPVPGKKGFVILEEHPDLPEIDVRGIAPGTPVEFPDPRNPSETIQFRVP